MVGTRVGGKTVRLWGVLDGSWMDGWMDGRVVP